MAKEFCEFVGVRMSKRDRRLAETAALLHGVSLSELFRRGMREQVSRALATESKSGRLVDAQAAFTE